MMSLGQKAIALLILLAFVVLAFVVGGWLGGVLMLFAAGPVGFAILTRL